MTKLVDKATNILTKGSNLILLSKAREIILEFKKKNIDFLLLKGLALAFTIYPDMGLRPMTDIDFLIKRKDLDSIDEILTRLGYSEVSPKEQRRYGCDIKFCNKHNIILDIHWDLCQYERFKGIIDITSDFWKRRVEFNLNGISVHTLSTEDHILFISLHYGLYHLFIGINGIWDLFYFINGRNVEWQKIIDSACKYGIKTPLYYSLLKASEVTGLKLPDFTGSALRPSFLKRHLLDYLLKYNTTALRYLCQALMLDNFSDTLKALVRLLREMPRAHRRTRANTVLNYHPDAPSSGHI